MIISGRLILALAGLGFTVLLGNHMGAHLSPDALGMAIGILFGILAGIPATLMVASHPRPQPPPPPPVDVEVQQKISKLALKALNESRNREYDLYYGHAPTKKAKELPEWREEW